MNNKLLEIIDKLAREHTLCLEEYKYLVENRTDEVAGNLAEHAVRQRREIYGNSVFIRVLIEISNICKNDCLYCGIRAGNKKCERYHLDRDDILECCENGYANGFRTFVMQSGENSCYSDEELCDLIGEIKSIYSDVAVTLSLGERSKESYKMLFDAGADRYLLRHETADSEHYAKLHPGSMSFDNRLRCLYNLKEIGYQVGCGFMVGSPYQTADMIAKDLKFIEEFEPDMCGIGPFIPHRDTPFSTESAGSAELTCYLLSIIRLIKPNILLPATTALSSVDDSGYEKGILAGANVVMPNLTPYKERKKYTLYNNKAISGCDAAESKALLDVRISNIGYEIVTVRGDIKEI